ncbi:MAG TPA: tetratricopeptide repeat protein [Terriglobales bacterium]|nr:tetratricopeptide repeat protein [Terriglobales bacterium]
MRPANYLGSILLILFLSASLAAQGRPSGGGTGGTGGRPASGNTPSGMPTTNIPPNINNPSTNLPPMLFMSGKVAVDDGSELTDSAMIESVCNGDRHFEAYTDRKGNFSFQFGQQRDIGAGDVATTDANVPGRSMTPQQQQRQLQQCELVAVLPGFTSQTVELSGTEVSESMNVGTIVLHRMAHVEGFTLSATTAMAPGKAKKAYEKGRNEEKKKKWEAAEKKFQEAVQIYPRFAVAWVELGRTQLEMKQEAAAKESLQKAVTADSQFVSPHQLLAVIALHEQRWQDVVGETNAVLRLNPLSFAQDWYYNAAANYYLGHYDVAEKSVRQAIQVDVEHRVPRAEYLLGIILTQKHDYQGAAEHLRNYVRLSPNATDVAQVNEQIAKIAKLSSSQSAVQK